MPPVLRSALKTGKEWGYLLPLPLIAGRDDRGLGLDWWAPRELKNLSVESIKKLTNIMNRSERVMAPPVQSLLSLIALIPKPIKGDRPVVLASMWFVLWSALRSPEVDPWEAEFVEHWDSAIRGSSALRAALRRRLFDEVNYFEGGATCILLLGLGEVL